MSVRVIDVFNQFSDNSGNPLAGGKVATYQAGTSTPLATYTEATGTTAQANPVVLDSDGRPSSPIYWTVGASYKVQLYDANDVLLDTLLVLEVPDVPAATQVFENDFNFLGGPPTASQELYRRAFASAVDYAANFAGSMGSVQTNPAASFAMTVAKNGSTVGTITVSTSGSFAFASTAGAAVSFSAGDVMTVTAPASTDSTVAGIAATFKGTLA